MVFEMIRPICASFPRCTPRRGKPARIPHHRKHRRSPVECHILRRGWKERDGRAERERPTRTKARARKKERREREQEGGIKDRGSKKVEREREGERERGTGERNTSVALLRGMKKVENRYRQKRIFLSRTR